MNIYEIGQDFDNYKFFVFKEDDESKSCPISYIFIMLHYEYI